MISKSRVCAEVARDNPPLRAKGRALSRKAQDLNLKGTVGDASLATREKGEAHLDHGARRFIELLEDVQKFDLARLWSPE